MSRKLKFRSFDYDYRDIELGSKITICAGLDQTKLVSNKNIDNKQIEDNMQDMHENSYNRLCPLKVIDGYVDRIQYALDDIDERLCDLESKDECSDDVDKREDNIVYVLSSRNIETKIYNIIAVYDSKKEARDELFKLESIKRRLKNSKTTFNIDVCELNNIAEGVINF